MTKESNKFDFTKKLTKYSAEDILGRHSDDGVFVVKWTDEADSRFEAEAEDDIVYNLLHEYSADYFNKNCVCYKQEDFLWAAFEDRAQLDICDVCDLDPRHAIIVYYTQATTADVFSPKLLEPLRKQGYDSVEQFFEEKLELEINDCGFFINANVYVYDDEIDSLNDAVTLEYRGF